jgi:ABC-type transport system involved in multi-copper enzyme maturation permease subunit
MTAGTVTPYRPDQQTGRGGFAQLLRSEWTKFRTVRGWVIGMILTILLTVGVGFLSHSNCSYNGSACPAPPLGPGGEAVQDNFYFAHQPLDGNGSITVRVTSLTGLYSPSGAVRASQGGRAGQGGSPLGMKAGVQPWSKAGIIIKASTTQGSAYAAMMVTGGNGVRMQWDYTNDTAGLAGNMSAASPRWLRLTRSGDTLTGYDSADGTGWTRVGTATLAGLRSTVQAGLFAASPGYSVTTTSLGGSSSKGGGTLATAVFDHVSRQGSWPGGGWTGVDIGGGSNGPGGAMNGSFHQAAGTMTVIGSGDIAPVVDGTGIRHTLVGTFAGLIAVIVVGTMFITAEYRRGLIRVTLAASPRRGRVLAAKAVVIGAVTFVIGLAAVFVALLVGEQRIRAGGNPIDPVPALTELRMVAGTAAMLAIAAVLALAIGTMLRRSAGAVAAVIAVIVLPYLLTVAVPIVPLGPADWLARVTPAAAFAVQQTVIQYPQVDNVYAPSAGYFPLPPWAGFAVLCAWAALALGLATYLLRRRDA